MIVQQKMMTPPPTDEQQAMQQKMMKYMMVFFGLMFYKVAAGLCLYFIASSLWGFAERKLLPKKKPGECTGANDPGRPTLHAAACCDRADGRAAAADRRQRRQRWSRPSRGHRRGRRKRKRGRARRAELPRTEDGLLAQERCAGGPGCWKQAGGRSESAALRLRKCTVTEPSDGEVRVLPCASARRSSPLLLTCAALPVLAQATRRHRLRRQDRPTRSSPPSASRPASVPGSTSPCSSRSSAAAGTHHRRGQRRPIVVARTASRSASSTWQPPKADTLTTVLAMDISGSMASNAKMVRGRAARPASSSTSSTACRQRPDPVQPRVAALREKPIRDAARLADHRARLRREVEAAEPLGGTAYLDATYEGVEMLRDVRAAGRSSS